MLARRLVAFSAALLLLLTLSPAVLAHSRDAPERMAPQQRTVGAHDAASSDTRLPGKPRNDVIEDVPVDPNDASIPLNLIPYHDIPAKLRELQASDRISVEIIGQSTLGRNLHLVVATSPMTDAQWDDWQALSDLRTEDPVAAIAAQQAGDYDDWKQPLFVNNNIHGNEWESTDGALEVMERLAFADDGETLRLLDENIMVFVVTHNPDGRVAGVRANANGFDLNRDNITASQVETRIVRSQMIRYNALTMLDMHGYVNCTLIGPATGPHGPDYEFDLYIRNAIRNGLAMEAAVIATGEPRATCAEGEGRRVDIPWRNRTAGWDDYPPIFTPMYAMYHGSIGYTIELPLNPRGTMPVEERHERTRINTLVARNVITANFEWSTTNQATLLADQLEMFRRGAAGEDSRPIDDPLALSLAAGNNAFTIPQSYPSAYVIPTGAGQRSETAAARVVQFLLDNDVIVQKAAAPVTVGGRRHPAGSYVIDMLQAKRGIANAILDAGRDVTELFPRMYDIAAWSQGHLWGATVVQITGGEVASGDLARVAAVSPTGSVAAGGAHHTLTVDSAAGVGALNRLLELEVEVTRLHDGRFVIDGSQSQVLHEVAAAFGVAFDSLPRNQYRHARPFTTRRVGTSASGNETFALGELGFDHTAVSHTGFNDGAYAFSDFDALYVSSTAFNPLNLNAEQQRAFADWLLAGGAVVGTGANGVTFNTRAALLSGVSTRNGPGNANGLTAMVNNPDSPITRTAIPSAFVSAPRTFTVAEGSDVRIDQRYAEGNFFLAGHWLGSGDASQEAAAGRPSVISGKGRGANVTLFGTEPLYRSHPEGMFPQVAEALWQSRICAPDFGLLRAELDALAGAGAITEGLESRVRSALDQTALWLSLDKQRPIAHTHMERAVHLLLWQADVIDGGKPAQGDADALRALAATIQVMLGSCAP